MDDDLKDSCIKTNNSGMFGSQISQDEMFMTHVYHE